MVIIYSQSTSSFSTAEHKLIQTLYTEKYLHRLINNTDRTLYVVFSRFRDFSFAITFRQRPEGVTRSALSLSCNSVRQKRNFFLSRVYSCIIRGLGQVKTERCGQDGIGGRAPRLGQAKGPGAAARSPSSRHSGNLKTATPSPESLPSENARLSYLRVSDSFYKS